MTDHRAAVFAQVSGLPLQTAKGLSRSPNFTLLKLLCLDCTHHFIQCRGERSSLKKKGKLWQSNSCRNMLRIYFIWDGRKQKRKTSGNCFSKGAVTQKSTAQVKCSLWIFLDVNQDCTIITLYNILLQESVNCCIVFKKLCPEVFDRSRLHLVRSGYFEAQLYMQ